MTDTYTFPKKTIKDIDVRGKTILMRADFNIPLEDGSDGQPVAADDYRIKQAVPTIDYLLKNGAKVVVISHLGRPEGKKDPKLSMKPAADALDKIIGEDVIFATECVGDVAKQAVKGADHGHVVVLENVRFHPEEEANDDNFASQLAELGEIFVQDGFGVVHRAHASTDAITHHLPSVAGLLLENEVTQITKAIKHPKKPVTAIIGGAKLETKADLVDNFVKIADTIIIGGAMANTMLVALGYRVGRSVYDKEEVAEAERILQDIKTHGTELILPTEDVAVSEQADETGERQEVFTDHIGSGDYILDFGSRSMSAVAKAIDNAGTVLWNGPLGMTELPRFAVGTEMLAKLLAKHKGETIVGGGDTAAFIDELGLVDKFTHVSTGGGASLELMAGLKLPGVEALLDK